MRAFGGFLIFAGFGSAILHFTDYQLRILIWSESMQPFLGLAIGAAGCVFIGISIAMEKNKAADGPVSLPPPQPAYGQPQQPYPPQQQPMAQPYGQQPQYPAQQQPYPAQQPYPPQQPGQYGQQQGYGPGR